MASLVFPGRRRVGVCGQATHSFSPPLPPPSPSLISHLAFVDIKQHIYLDSSFCLTMLDMYSNENCQSLIKIIIKITYCYLEVLKHTHPYMHAHTHVCPPLTHTHSLKSPTPHMQTFQSKFKWNHLFCMLNHIILFKIYS